MSSVSLCVNKKCSSFRDLYTMIVSTYYSVPPSEMRNLLTPEVNIFEISYIS